MSAAEASLRPSVLALILPVLGLVLVAGCAKERTPFDVALDYGRAVYASDTAAIYRLVSSEDRRVKDEATFRRQRPEPSGFTREVMRQLASYVTATPVKTTVTNARASVTLKLRLPDANAPEIAALARNWDDDRLAALTASERKRVTDRLAELRRAGSLPMVEGDETIELTKDDAGWRVFLNWAGGVRVRFAATVDAPLALDVTVSPSNVVLNPGDRIRVTLRARNRASREVTTRVGHRIEPAAQARHLALLQCPLFVPITLVPGEEREFVSVYLVPGDAPRDLPELVVTYQFPARS